MREILVRGKRTYNGEWIEGYLTKDIDYRQKELTGIKTKQIKEKYGANIYYCYHTYDVIPETVGQYTGLTDKNGKKIFEGDIVAGALWWLEQPKYGIVTFRDGSFGLLWYRGEAEQFNPFTSMCNIQYEVVGNIVDNKDFYESEVLTNE